MNNEDVKKYIEQNGNARLVLDTLKAMQTEGAEMSIEELDRRLHPKHAKKSEPAPKEEPLITINFSEDELKRMSDAAKEEPSQPQPSLEKVAAPPPKRNEDRKKSRIKTAKKSKKETKRKQKPAVNDTETARPAEPAPEPQKETKPKKKKEPKPPKENNGEQLLERLALIRTIASVVIALVLVLALAAILIIAVAPDSDIALFIDRLIDPVSSTFGLIEDARISAA